MSKRCALMLMFDPLLAGSPQTALLCFEGSVLSPQCLLLSFLKPRQHWGSLRRYSRPFPPSVKQQDFSRWRRGSLYSFFFVRKTLGFPDEIISHQSGFFRHCPEPWASHHPTAYPQEWSTSTISAWCTATSNPPREPALCSDCRGERHSIRRRVGLGWRVRLHNASVCVWISAR